MPSARSPAKKQPTRPRKRRARFHNIYDASTMRNAKTRREERETGLPATLSVRKINAYIREKNIKDGDIIFRGAPPEYPTRPEYGFAIVNRRRRKLFWPTEIGNGASIVEAAKYHKTYDSTDYSTATRQVKSFCRKDWTNCVNVVPLPW